MPNASEHSLYRFGAFALHLERGVLLTADNAEIVLRPKSFALLRMLVENAGRLLSRDAIMDALWPGLYVSDDNLTQCVHDVRRALEPDSHLILRTVQRRGYLFAAAVTTGDAPGSAAMDAPPVGVEAPPMVRRRPWLSMFVATLRDLDGGEAYASLVEEISDGIRADLSQIPGCFVIGRTDRVFDDHAGARDIGRVFDVNYVIQGSIRPTATALAVNIQLIDAENGSLLWADRFDAAYDDGILTPNDTTGRLVRSLYLKMTEDVARRIETAPPSEWTANDLVLRGRAIVNRPASEGNRLAAAACFEQALAAEPHSVGARMGLCGALIGNVADGWSRSNGADLARAEQLLGEVLRVDATVPMAHCMMGLLRRLQGRLAESRIELEMAIHLSQNYALAFGQLGATLIYLGQPAAAVPQIERSLRVAPNDAGSPINQNNLALAFLLLGRTPEAIVCLTKARAANPRLWYVHALLAAAFGLMDDLEAARGSWQTASRLAPELTSAAGLRGLLRLGSPAFAAMFDRTVSVGLRRAGMADDG